MRKREGFTLIEVIIMITLSALVAAVVVPYLGTSLTGSGEAVNGMVEAFEVNRVMENILAEYRYRVRKEDPNGLSVFRNDLSGFQEMGVTVTGTFIVFNQKAGLYEDFNGDGVYDPVAADEGNPPDNLMLLVTASKNSQSLRITLGDWP